jgi:hypothetical protein
MARIDEAAVVRPDEELDIGKVGDFLKKAIPGLRGNVSVKQFPCGYSNLTYLVSAGNREMILRRPPFGKKPKSGHDMSREFRSRSSGTARSRWLIRKTRPLWGAPSM